MATDVLSLELNAVARLIRRRKISASELVRACIAQADEWQPRINAFIALDADGALRNARLLDRQLARGDTVGPLHGVPLAHKDMFYRRGQVSSCGSALRREWTAPRDSTVMTKLSRAGAIALGRLNMSEFAAHPTGENEHFGACLNPWDRAYVAGGSSSGSGAAVAARIVFGALGSDTGGSIRIPAALNGVCGLMPTYGRVSRYGAMARSWSLDHIGTLARSAADCALLLEVIAGHDPRDGNSAALAPPRLAAALRQGIQGLRVGVPRLPKGIELAPAVAKAWKASREVLKSLGASAVPVTLPDLSAMYHHCEIIVRSEAASMHGAWLRERRQDYSAYMRARIEGGFFIPATWYIQSLSQRGPALAKFLDQVMTKCDVLHLPTMPGQVPSVAETQAPNTDPKLLARLGGMAVFTRPFNYLGLPAISMPSGFDEGGLPLAFQLVARPFDEATLLRVAHAFQTATGWHQRAPSSAVKGEGPAAPRPSPASH
jgi:aspartyl-tRNA(Asn)/glutamyl-tRNA(Gln) amidotransferase subunit A